MPIAHQTLIYKRDLAPIITQLIKQIAQFAYGKQVYFPNLLLAHFQSFLDDESEYNSNIVYDRQLIDFLVNNGWLETWIKCFQQPETTNTQAIWDGPLSEFFTGRSKLVFAGVNPALVKQLDACHMLDREYCHHQNANHLYKIFMSIEHYRQHSKHIQLWELLCLTGAPDALIYAFKKLGVTPLTTNLFGEMPIHLAVRSQSSRQVYQALKLGCHPNQRTQASTLNSPLAAGSTALHIAASDNNRDLTLYLLKKTDANILQADANGATPRTLAIKNHAYDVLTLFNCLPQELPNKVSIFIPFGMYCEGRFSRDKFPNAEQIERYHNTSFQLLPSEVDAEKPVDFTMLARRIKLILTNTDEFSGQRRVHHVAENMDEFQTIAKNDFYLESYFVVYAVKVSVNIDDLACPRSKIDVYGEQFNAVNGWKHWRLKPNANIQMEDIQSISLCFDYPTTDHKITTCVNLHANPNNHLSHLNAKNIQSYISNFLANSNFWQQHVYPSKTYLGMSLFPKAIQEMQALCQQESTFVLGAFRDIATRYYPNQYTGVAAYAHSLFSPDEICKSFYLTVMKAKSFYDIATWIEAHELELAPTIQSCALI